MLDVGERRRHERLEKRVGHTGEREHGAKVIPGCCRPSSKQEVIPEGDCRRDLRPMNARDRHLQVAMTDTRTEELAELTSRLVEFDSVNPALVPGGGGERAIALFVADWCAARGLEVEIVGEERTSVIARRPGSGGGRSLLLNGTLETVGCLA